MVEEGRGRQLSRLSFEDLRTILDSNKNLRAAVIKHLAQNHTAEFVKHVTVTTKTSKTK